MLDEVVERRGWVSRRHFVQLLGITNLLPGPNSSEMAIHLGYTQRGWPGALATGLSFLLPTFVLVLGFSWAYFTWGTLPAVEPLFWGLKPVVVGLILVAGVKLLRAAAEGPLLLALAGAGIVLALTAGTWAVAGMLAGGVATWLVGRFRREGGADGGDGPTSDESSGESYGGSSRNSSGESYGDSPDHSSGESYGGSPTRGAFALLSLPGLALGGELLRVFVTHLWMGAVLFGGGYVLVGLLEPYAVGRFGWLTAAEFLDGVALTQAVPGPISTLSAFVGFAAAGVPGALLGTAGIYLPAFAAVLFVAPHVERLREKDRIRDVLGGVSAVAAGVVLGVGLGLLPGAVGGAGAAALLAGSLAAGASGRVAAPWIVLAGLGAGALRALVG